MALIEGRDYHIVTLCLPASVHEVIYWNGYDHYTIFLNSRDSFARRRQAFRHALLHAEKGDFRAFDVQMIELSRHGGKHGKTA